MKYQFQVAAAGLALGLALSSSAFAETMTFKADLSGAQEVPATTSKGAGKIEATYDTATKKLSWKGEYSGLTGPATMAHFHGPAAAGANAGVAVPVEAKASPFMGSAELTAAQAADLEAGKYYFNVHTADNKGGEIRGQMMKAK